MSGLQIKVNKDAIFILSKDFIQSGLSSLIITRNTPLNEVKMAELDADETNKYMKSIE